MKEGDDIMLTPMLRSANTGMPSKRTREHSTGAGLQHQCISAVPGGSVLKRLRHGRGEIGKPSC
jgi:hypothetical protein